MAAVIYDNHGVGLGGRKRYQEALLAYFWAMSPDPEFGWAVKNALATLANWTLALAKDEQWEQAIAVVTTGLALAPQDPALRTNHHAVWTR